MSKLESILTFIIESLYYKPQSLLALQHNDMTYVPHMIHTRRRVASALTGLSDCELALSMSLREVNL